MPRAFGQIDRIKSEAILEAAARVIAERGMTAPVEAIAKRAGVSKQTLYNHFGGKAGLMRVLVQRRIATFSEPLVDPGGDAPPEAALAAFARGLMPALLSEHYLTLLRVAIQGAADMPELARTMFETGSEGARTQLTAYLRAQTRAGRLAVDDVDEAAELFFGMVAARQMRGLMGFPSPRDEPETLEKLCGAIARRFVRAYAPG
jgi:TetR/AcrR family transcriptional repressor of mexJK operon